MSLKSKITKIFVWVKKITRENYADCIKLPSHVNVCTLAGGCAGDICENQVNDSAIADPLKYPIKLGLDMYHRLVNCKFLIWMLASTGPSLMSPFFVLSLLPNELVESSWPYAQISAEFVQDFPGFFDYTEFVDFVGRRAKLVSVLNKLERICEDT